MKNACLNTSLLCLLSFLLFSQQPFHSYDQFDKSNGLTSPIKDMEQDDDGFFWLATQDGLFRFDGVRATKIHLPVPDSLSELAGNTTNLSYDRKNQRIWLATAAGFFRVELRTGDTGYLNPKDFIKEKDLEAPAAPFVFADRQGEVWMQTKVYGLANLLGDGKTVEVFRLPLDENAKAAGLDEKMANSIRGISQDPNHEHLLWMNCRRGLMKFDKKTKRPERFIFYPDNPKMLTDANSMPCHYAHPNGFVYVGTWDAGLLKFDPANGTFTQFLRTKEPWQETAQNTHRVTSIVPGKNGNLWTDGSGGGALFDVKTERFISSPTDGFNVDFQDRDGNYWQFKGGLRLFHRLKNQGPRHEFPASLPCEQLTGIPFDSRNRQIYFRGFCQDGAFWALHVDSLQWQRLPLPGRGESERILFSGFVESPMGFFVLESLREILYLRPPRSKHFEKVPVAFPHNSGHLSLACSKSGELLVTGHDGWLFWLKPPDAASGRRDWDMKTFSKTALGGTLPDDFYCTSAPVFDRTGRLWMRTCDGFSIFSPESGSFQYFSKKQEGVKHLENYQYFLPDEQGRMWVSGNGGFGWFDIEKPDAGLQKWYVPPGKFRHGVFGIHFFIHEKLWLNTSQGWAEFDPEKETYRFFDFLRVNQLEHLGGGRLLAIEGKAFRLMHVDSLRVSEDVPKPYVAWFKVFEQAMALPGGLLSPHPVRLKPGENFFSIGFSALASYNTQGIQFAYQLEGLNPDWVYPEPGVPAASFTNVGGGDYTFKIKTTNSRGEWLNNVFEMKIHVGTPWWKTWWFRLAVVAALVASVYFLMKNRLRQQQILLENQRLQLEKEQSLRNERDRIAAEMHDDLGAGLSTIRFLSLAAKEKETDSANAARIDKIANHAALVMEKMADIIWVMNSRNDSLENFAAYLRRYASEYCDTHGIRLHFAVPDPMPRLSLRSEQRRTLLLAVKESLHNMVKHAVATEAWVSIQTNGALEIEVRDDGKGIPHELLEQFQNNDKILTGNGLYNLRQRMESLGGELVLENEQGISVKLKTGIVV